MSRGKKGFGVSMALLLGIALLCGPAGAQLITSDQVGGADELAPAPVGAVTVMADQDAPSVAVGWALSPDDFVRPQAVGTDFTSGGVYVNVNDVAGYKVWREEVGGDAEVLVTLPAGATSYDDGSVAKGSSYTYMVTVIDGAGLESPAVASEVVTIKRPAVRYTMTVQTDVGEVEGEVVDLDALLADPDAKQKLIDDLVAILAEEMGVDPERITILNIDTGSLIVEFEVLEDEDPTTPTADEAVAALDQTLAEDPATFATQIEDGTDLGDVEGVEGGIVEDPSIDLSGVAFNFALVAVGETDTKELSITNTGDLTLNGSLALDDDTVFAISETSFSLDGDASLVVEISFTPADTVAYEASIQITSNDPENPSLTVLLSGKGQGEVDVWPGDHDGDDDVDFDDFFLFADAFGSTPADDNWNPLSDQDGDDDVDFDDFFLFADRFGTTAGG